MKKYIIIAIAVLGGVGLIGGGWYLTQQNNLQTSEILTEGRQRESEMNDEETQEDTEQIGTTMDINPNAQPIVAKVEISSSEIQGFVFSSSVSGANASLFDHSTSFFVGDKTLWLTVRLSAQSTADSVLFSMMYAKDKSTLGPARVAIKEQNGSKFAVFKLTSPEKGWPVGEYVGTIFLPNGDSKTFNFKID